MCTKKQGAKEACRSCFEGVGQVWLNETRIITRWKKGRVNPKNGHHDGRPEKGFPICTNDKRVAELSIHVL